MGVGTTAVLVGAGIRLLEMAVDFFRYNNLSHDEVEQLFQDAWEEGLMKDPSNLEPPEEM